MRPLIWASVALLTAVAARADEWPQFRGPNASGIASVDLPDQWGHDENLRWKAALPGHGLSGPIVAAGKVIITANSGLKQSRLHVLAYDAQSGQAIWQRQFWATGQTFCNPLTCMAAPTPATDGKFIYALFATGDLACLEMDGTVVWLRGLAADYPLMTNHVGRAASPILADGVLIVPLESQGASHVVGIDCKTGRNLWKIDRALENNFATPVVARRWGRTEVLVQSPNVLTALDPSNGNTLWSYEGEPFSAIPSPISAGDVVIGMLARGMVAIRPSAGAAPTVEWKSQRLSSVSPSPLVSDGKIYVIKMDILTCGDLADGKLLWDIRLKGHFWASPVLAGGKLYVVSEAGIVTVVRPGAKGEVVATSDLKDKFFASPAIANGGVYLRSDQFLYHIGKAPGRE